ncbi:hypothetical protein H0W26_01975 [Candidatus Dependentiae bacterium]|nr:hypothetical protein [Candidatus Dependentiae bacterium]
MNVKSFLYVVGIAGFSLVQAAGNSYPRGADLFYGEVSSSFIIRWAFQHFCDHVFDPRTGEHEKPTTRNPGGVTFDPLAVKLGDSIFVRKIDLFMETMHDKIQVPYLMVTHGDFLDVSDEKHISYLDDEKIIAWFSIHPPKRWHPKYFPIPLGVFQEKEFFAEKQKYNDFFKELRNKPKTILLTGIFDAAQKDERASVDKVFRGKSFCFSLANDVPFKEYMDKLASSVFVLSPRGIGPDCYTTWEALLVGTIPIVKRGKYGVKEDAREHVRSHLYNPVIRAQLDRLYENLPILVIDEWNEVTEEFLEQKYKEISSRHYSIEPLYIEYWRTLITTVKEEYIENYQQKAGFSLDERNLSRALEYVKEKSHFSLLAFIKSYLFCECSAG